MLLFCGLFFSFLYVGFFVKLDHMPLTVKLYTFLQISSDSNPTTDILGQPVPSSSFIHLSNYIPRIQLGRFLHLVHGIKQGYASVCNKCLFPFGEMVEEVQWSCSSKRKTAEQNPICKPITLSLQVLWFSLG